jgi:hypothetical protein
MFPSVASGAFELRDAASGLAVSVTLKSAQGATVQVASGYLVYSAAYEGTADVLQRPYSSGTEQSIAFASRPSVERVTYDVALGAGIAGVRLVANTVEFLDKHGAPRLRMAPPFLAGAQSTDAWPTVSVTECAVDTSPAPPWNRTVVSPGRRHCTANVDWSGSGIQYPALLDPAWTVGSSMAVGRLGHASAVVTANGRELALAFGGYAFTSTLSSAELFDETTQTWAQTGSLVADISYAPAVSLNPTTVLAVGGFRVSAAGGTEYDGVQAYNATTGQWTLQGHLGSAREEHTATLLANGNVLVAGGFGAYPQVFASALVYNPLTGQATAAGSMSSARGDHTATLLASGKVLVVDGLGPNAVAASATDLYDPVANSWSTLAAPPLAPRFSHVAPLLPSGKVLIAGGDQLTSGVGQAVGTAVFDPTRLAWTPGPSTSYTHSTGTAVVLTQGANAGRVLLAGGDTGLNQVELFDPATSTWTTLAPLLTGRDSHIAALLQSGVLLAGGSDSRATILSSAELYKPDLAAAAPTWPASPALTVTSSSATSATLTWPAAADPRGVASYTIYENGQLVATVSGSTLTYVATGLTPGAAVTFTVQAVDPGGAPSASGPTQTYAVVPPNSTLVAPPVNRSAPTSLAGSTAFLYTGANPVQTGVDAGAIAANTQAVVRGQVTVRNGSALAGVTVTVVNHPEFGSTVTQSDGHFDMVVNSGQTLRVHYAAPGYLPAERVVQAPWQDYVIADDVALTPLDSQITAVNVATATTTQVARGSVSSDSSGTRQATVLVPAATTATRSICPTAERRLRRR